MSLSGIEVEQCDLSRWDGWESDDDVWFTHWLGRADCVVNHGVSWLVRLRLFAWWRMGATGVSVFAGFCSLSYWR